MCLQIGGKYYIANCFLTYYYLNNQSLVKEIKFKYSWNDDICQLKAVERETS